MKLVSMLECKISSLKIDFWLPFRRSCNEKKIKSSLETKNLKVNKIKND